MGIQDEVSCVMRHACSCPAHHWMCGMGGVVCVMRLVASCCQVKWVPLAQHLSRESLIGWNGYMCMSVHALCMCHKVRIGHAVRLSEYT